MINSINLKDFIERISYNKNQTYTKLEVLEEISKIQLLEIVSSLPTSNIKSNKIYLVLNGEEIENNRYDLFVYVDGRWEQIDNFEFNIEDYPTKTELQYLLNSKSDVGHVHDNASSTVDGFMSKEDKTKFDTISPSDANPLMDGAVSQGTSTKYSRQDHKHPSDNSKVDVVQATASMNVVTGSDKKITLESKNSHSHGNIQSNGSISNANSKNVVTDSNGNIITEDKYAHPSYPATTGKPTSDLTPSFGDNVIISQVSSDNKGHVTNNVERSIKIPDNLGNGTKKGLTTNDYTTNEKNKLNGVEEGANKYVHPSYASKSSGLYKVTIDNTGHVSGTASPTATDLPSHTHDTGLVKDTSAYGNIGSSANATQKTINDKINTGLGLKANSSDVYSKSETMTSTEIANAIVNGVSNVELFEVVSSLPTSNIKGNKFYLTPNNESINQNVYDIYIRVNNKWEQIDSLEFNIEDYYTSEEVDNLLNGKVNTTDSRLTDSRTPKSHSHGNITNTGAVGNTANKPLITSNNGVVTTGSFGTTENTFCQGNDSRLSDARTPKSHSHGNITNGGAIGSASGKIITTTNNGVLTASDKISKSQISDFPTSLTPTSHSHGDISNDGKIGSTANLPVVTGTSGKLTTGSFESTSSNIKMNGTANTGSLNTFARADHIHPTDTSRASSTHTHGNIANNGTLNSDTTSVNKIVVTDGNNNIKTINKLPLNNVTHQDISGKAPVNHKSTSTTYGVGDASNYGHVKVDTSMNDSSTNTVQNKVVKDYIDTQIDSITNGDVDLSDTHNHNDLYYTEDEIDTLLNNKVDNTDSRLTDARTPKSHSHGSLTNTGTLNSDITSVNKIAVTDSSNNLKTISQLPYSKISGTPTIPSKTSQLTNDSGFLTSQSITGKVDKSNGVSQITDTNANNYTNIGTLSSGATQQVINKAINDKIASLTNIDLVKLVTSLPTASASTMNQLYVVSKTSNTNNDAYNIYVTVKNGSNYAWEKIDDFDLQSLSIAWGSVTGKPSTFTPTAHAHGNISNDGKIGSTANLPVITGTNGVLQASSFGTGANTFCQGNDSRLSNTRTPTDNTVSTAKIQDSAVTSAKIADGTIVNADISSDASIDFSKLNISKANIVGLGIPSQDTNTTYSADESTLTKSSANVFSLKDSTNYVKKSSTSGLLKNDGSVDTKTYLTATDISGKENVSNKTASWNSTTNDTRYPTEKLVKTSLDGKINTSAIKNDLTTGGATNVLSAEQGKVLQNNKLNNTQTFISANTDLNTVKSAGWYYNNSNANVRTMSNTPWQTAPPTDGTTGVGWAFSMLVLKSYGTVQLLFPYNSGNYLNNSKYKCFIRINDNNDASNGWRSWWTLMDTELIAKLNGIEEGANKYTHPSNLTALSSDLYKITTNNNGHVTAGSKITIDSAPSNNANNLVSSKGVYDAIDNLNTTIVNAVSNLEMIEVVTSLPTTNIKTNKLYLKPNTVNGSENKYDFYVRVNNNWEKIDSLDFSISDYIKKDSNTNLLLSNGATKPQSDFATNTHGHSGTYVDGAGTKNTTNGSAIAEIKANTTVKGTIYHPKVLSSNVSSGLYKIAVNTDGHVTGTASVSASDLPSSIPTSKISGLSSVATSGSYKDLSNKPSFAQDSNITSSTSGRYAIGTLNLDGTNNVTLYGKDTNTTYSKGDGLLLSNNTFSADFGTGNKQVARGDHTHSNYLTSVATSNITNNAVTLAKLNSDVYDTTNGGTSGSSKLITSNAVYNALNNVTTHTITHFVNRTISGQAYSFTTNSLIRLDKIGKLVICNVHLEPTNLPKSQETTSAIPVCYVADGVPEGFRPNSYIVQGWVNSTSSGTISFNTDGSIVCNNVGAKTSNLVLANVIWVTP